MNDLFTKRELNEDVSKEDFLKDIDCLFEILRQAYGMYEYYGEAAFSLAKERAVEGLSSGPFELRRAVECLKNALCFLEDGHFRIGPREDGTAPACDYAIRHGFFHGIPLIDCKKFYYDSDEERTQLESLASSADRYKNTEPLIIDLRGNEGGSTVYIYDFLRALLGREISYAMKYVQKNSRLFLEYLKHTDFEYDSDEGVEVVEESLPPTKNEKPIYVLIDERTGSASEEAVAYLNNIENTVTVGTHTSGCFCCGNCMEVYLPNSHLQAYLGTGLVLYEGHRNIDAEGGFKAKISYNEFLEKFELDILPTMC